MARLPALLLCEGDHDPRPATPVEWLLWEANFSAPHARAPLSVLMEADLWRCRRCDEGGALLGLVEIVAPLAAPALHPARTDARPEERKGEARAPHGPRRAPGAARTTNRAPSRSAR